MTSNTVELWRGPSEIDGSPIVLLATGFASASDNSKTGDMIQTWIMRADMEPTVAVKTGADASICGKCPLRGDGSGKDRPCYVTVFQAPLAVYRAWKAGNVDKMSIHEASILIGRTVGSWPIDRSSPYEKWPNGRAIRVGAYGDPAAVPFEVWQELVEFAPVRTGYTHQWRTADPRFRSLIMASVDTVGERREAMRKGWRTFRTRSASMPLRPGEIVCPASDEGGKKTTCAKCHLCDGRSKGDKRPTIVIVAHGARAGQWEKAVNIPRVGAE